VPAAREKLDVPDNDIWVPGQVSSRPVQANPATVIWNVYSLLADSAGSARRAGTSAVSGLDLVAHPGILRAPAIPPARCRRRYGD
jgi:hypothetical protein